MTLQTRLAQTVVLFIACLREIFDEAPYHRFLHLHRISSSPDAYAEFSREQAAVKARRPRCC
jgi:hypothetical protein